MFCKFCGKEISDSSKFCEFCGESLSTDDKASENFNDSARWASICLQIAKKLTTIRNVWFNKNVELLESSSKKDGLDIKIKNRNLGGDGELAIKAFQLHTLIGILHLYIPQEKGSYFSDILFASVCGEYIEECLIFFGSYEEVSDDGATLVFRISSDVAKYITGSENPLVESVLISSNYIPLSLMTQISTAEAFQDYKNAKELSESLNDYFKKNKY